MNKYNRAKIYKIITNKDPSLIYVGSTCQSLGMRKAKHKSCWKCYNNPETTYKQGYMYSFKIFDVDENPDILLLEDVKCERKEQLHARERIWIEKFDCVNKNIPARTKKECIEYNKEYYEQNKDKLNKYNKEYKEQNKDKIQKYYEQNKDKIKECAKKYYEQNKDKIKELKKEYKEANKDKIKQYKSEKIECEICGSCVRRGDISRHKKTKKCIQHQ